MKFSEYTVPKYLWPSTVDEWCDYLTWFYGLSGCICFGIVEV